MTLPVQYVLSLALFVVGYAIGWTFVGRGLAFAPWVTVFMGFTFGWISRGRAEEGDDR